MTVEEEQLKGFLALAIHKKRLEAEVEKAERMMWDLEKQLGLSKIVSMHFRMEACKIYYTEEIL